MASKNYLTGLRDFADTNKPRFISYLLAMLLVSQLLLVILGEPVTLNSIAGALLPISVLALVAVSLNYIYPRKK